MISVKLWSFPASPGARRTFLRLKITLTISVIVCWAYAVPGQIWKPAPLRLRYEVGGRLGLTVSGSGKSRGYIRCLKWDCSIIDGTYIKMSIPETGANTIASFDLHEWKTWALRDLCVSEGLSPETRGLGLEPWDETNLGT